MFEMMIVELIIAENKKYNFDSDVGQSQMKPVQFRPSLVDRLLAVVGEAMISVGLKLKDRPHHRLASDQGPSSNFLIML